MINRDALSERVAFRLSAEARRKLAQWAHEEHRALANLISAIVYQAIRDEEARRGQAFETEGHDLS